MIDAILNALVSGAAGGVCVLVGLLLVVRPHARRRVFFERARIADADAKTWRAVAPMLVGAQPGSLSAIAGLVQAEAPAGLSYTFRARDTAALPLGVVRVSIEVGNKADT